MQGRDFLAMEPVKVELSTSCCGNRHPTTTINERKIDEITFRTLLQGDLDEQSHLPRNRWRGSWKAKDSTSQLTACTDAGSRSQALYISSTYPALDPLRKGSAAAEL